MLDENYSIVMFTSVCCDFLLKKKLSVYETDTLVASSKLIPGVYHLLDFTLLLVLTYYVLVTPRGFCFKLLTNRDKKQMELRQEKKQIRYLSIASQSTTCNHFSLNNEEKTEQRKRHLKPIKQTLKRDREDFASTSCFSLMSLK